MRFQVPHILMWENETRRSCTSESSFDTVPKFSSISEIHHDATRATLNYDCQLACPICVGKIDIFRKASSWKKTKFQYLSESSHCEKRWKINYISNKLACAGCFLAHVQTYERLGIPPLIKKDGDKFVFEQESILATKKKYENKSKSIKLIPALLKNATKLQ